MPLLPQPGAASTTLHPRPEPIRRRTLILLRWVALAGQLSAIFVAWAIGVQFAIWPTLTLIGVGGALNLWLTNSHRRMTPNGAAWQLVFDLVQISALIGLTGGLQNPFALLVLAPVTIAAAALEGRQTILVGLATVVMIALAGWFAAPLSHPRYDLAVPPLVQLGHLSALLIGVVFFAGYSRRVSSELALVSDALFATQMALAREQKLQHLGGIVAAAAHEMGTPLATIKLIAGELKSELQDALPERTDLIEDAATLASSADRCRDIMRSMGQAGKDDLLVHAAPLRTVLEEAAEPHAQRGILVQLPDAPGPIIHREPGIIHGLRNIIQNAVDFAEKRVDISADTDGNTVSIRVCDDGPGFPQQTLSRLAEPFPARSQRRSGYEGMGLGLFIARTLLESSGAAVECANGDKGAVVRVSWPRGRITANDRQVLEANPCLD